MFSKGGGSLPLYNGAPFQGYYAYKKSFSTCIKNMEAPYVSPLYMCKVSMYEGPPCMAHVMPFKMSYKSYARKVGKFFYGHNITLQVCFEFNLSLDHVESRNKQQ